MTETKSFVKEIVAKVNAELTRRMAHCSYSEDKLEAHSRRLNLTLSGIASDGSELRNSSITVDKVVNELADIDCIIQKDDISECYRLHRKNTANSAPPLIMIRFVSQHIRDKVLSYSTRYKNADNGKYMNEDMTGLQRKLFSYLRSKDDVVIKKT